MSNPPAPLKLNLGCGQNPRPGYVNVDKNGSPDVRWDLEQFPWPWPDNSADEVILFHVLEHLGATTELYLGIVQELYRVCRDGAMVYITVPHPRHDDFLNDPTHVRAVTPNSWHLFSRAKNLQWKKERASNTPLAMYLGVDFELVRWTQKPDRVWLEKLNSGAITVDQLDEAAREHLNVVGSPGTELEFAL